MQKKVFITFICILLFTVELYALSWRTENVYIRNHLSENIIILAEFLEYHQETRWIQKIAGIDVLLSDYFKLYHEEVYNNEILPYQSVIVLRANEILDVVSYFPRTGIDNFLLDLAKLQELPLKVKFQDIFKELIIQDSNGNILFTLDTIDKVPLTYMYDQDDIILEIYPEEEINL